MNFESLGFTGPGVAFGARVLLRAEVTRGLIKVSNQSVATVRKSQLLGSQLTILDTKKEEFPTAVVALRRIFKSKEY